MYNKKRVELIVKEWFELKTGVCLSDETLSRLVDDITETKQCDIPVSSIKFVEQREMSFDVWTIGNGYTRCEGELIKEGESFDEEKVFEDYLNELENN